MRDRVIVMTAVIFCVTGCGGGEERVKRLTQLTAAEVAHTRLVVQEGRRALRRGDAVNSVEAFRRGLSGDVRRSRRLCRKGAAAGPTFRALSSDCLEAAAVGRRFTQAVVEGVRCDELTCTIRFLRRLTIELGRLNRIIQAYVRETEDLRITDACRTIIAGSERTQATSRNLVGELKAALDAARDYQNASVGSAEERESEKSYDQTYETWFETFEDYGRQLERDLEVRADACTRDPDSQPEVDRSWVRRARVGVKKEAGAIEYPDLS